MQVTSLDVLWILLSAALVMLMQVGFLCLETGLTRSKNNINVAAKNLADFALAVFLFWLVGFGFMYGKGTPWTLSWLGLDRFALTFKDADAFSGAFFLFQAMFCGAAVTIVSGAVAERMRFSGYLMVAIFLSALIYPVFGHWVWNGLDQGSMDGFLARLGFVDFAGATVVHSLGGWAALALVLVLGPRKGIFDLGPRDQPFIGSSLPIAALGVLLLYTGWLGFNGGSVLKFEASVTGI